MIETSTLLDDFRDARHLFSDAGKKDRERCNLEDWCRQTGKEYGLFVQAESGAPDFSDGEEHVEITEALPPGCKRQDEWKKAMTEIQEGNLPQPWNADSLKSVLMGGHHWVLNAIDAKAKKYGSSARGWVLLVYVNFSFWQRIRWDLVKSHLAAIPHPFRRIDALTADGQKVIVLFP